MKDKNKADISIDKTVKDCTTKCDKDFKCLTQSSHDLCKVTEIVKDEVFLSRVREKRIVNISCLLVLFIRATVQRERKYIENISISSRFTLTMEVPCCITFISPKIEDL